jgi:DNA polymerase-4
VASDLQRKGYVGKTIGIKLRYDDFKSVTRDHTLDHYTDDARTLRKIAGQCLKRVPLTQRLRLLGVRVGSLAKAGSREMFMPNSPLATEIIAQETINSVAFNDQLF